MKTLILSTTSRKIATLNVLTAPNKLRYAELHGYEFINEECDYGWDQVTYLKKLRVYLDEYATIMTVGCDVLFMNLMIKVDHLPWNDVTIAREHLDFWPINNDVMVWNSTPNAKWLLDTLIQEAPTWLEYPWLWQNHLWNMLCEGGRIEQVIKVCEARVMNSTHQPTHTNGKRIPGPSSWQLGDWIIHFLDYPISVKIDLAKAYLPFVGNGSYLPPPPKQALILTT